MTKEERDLLVKDLCARLPYGVKVTYFDHSDHKWYIIESIDITDNEAYISTLDPYYTNKYVNLRCIKPYLKPMSSITEEQKRELPFESSLINAFISGYISLFEDEELTASDIVGILDWLNKHHFDYRGLIEKGLAIDCTNLNIY